MLLIDRLVHNLGTKVTLPVRLGHLRGGVGIGSNTQPRTSAPGMHAKTNPMTLTIRAMSPIVLLRFAGAGGIGGAAYGWFGVLPHGWLNVSPFRHVDRSTAAQCRA